jgi:hypothetical protein
MEIEILEKPEIIPIIIPTTTPEAIPEIIPIIIPEIMEQRKITPELLEMINNDAINHLKKMRNEILLNTDKYLLSDYPITSEQLEIIKTFRKALRDFTKNNYIMPDKPDFYCG